MKGVQKSENMSIIKWKSHVCAAVKAETKAQGLRQIMGMNGTALLSL